MMKKRLNDEHDGAS